MKKIYLYFQLVVTVFILNACDSETKKSVSPTEIFADSVFDNHSYSNINKIRTKHLHIDLDINFENKTVYGIARHEMINNGTDTAIFDIKSLDIQKITLGKRVKKKKPIS